jgi:hypothetical protein
VPRQQRLRQLRASDAPRPSVHQSQIHPVLRSHGRPVHYSRDPPVHHSHGRPVHHSRDPPVHHSCDRPFRGPLTLVIRDSPHSPVCASRRPALRGVRAPLRGYLSPVVRGHWLSRKGHWLSARWARWPAVHETLVHKTLHPVAHGCLKPVRVARNPAVRGVRDPVIRGSWSSAVQGSQSPVGSRWRMLRDDRRPLVDRVGRHFGAPHLSCCPRRREPTSRGLAWPEPRGSTTRQAPNRERKGRSPPSEHAKGRDADIRSSRPSLKTLNRSTRPGFAVPGVCERFIEGRGDRE